MKNKLFPSLFALPFVTGICGALLRASQIKHAYDAETGILRSGEPVTYGLVAVCVIAALIALLAAFLLKSGVQIKSPKFSRGVLFATTAASSVLLVYAAMTLYTLLDEFNTTALVLGLISIYCAIAFLVLAKYSFAERDDVAYCVFSAVPSFWACFMLVLAFRDKISDPIIANYVPMIFSYLSILIFCYCVAAHILDKNKKHVAVFSCFFGIFFILTELFSPLFAKQLVEMSAENIRYLLPQLAFLLLMPAVTAVIIKK